MLTLSYSFHLALSYSLNILLPHSHTLILSHSHTVTLTHSHTHRQTLSLSHFHSQTLTLLISHSPTLQLSNSHSFSISLSPLLHYSNFTRLNSHTIIISHVPVACSESRSLFLWGAAPVLGWQLASVSGRSGSPTSGAAKIHLPSAWGASRFSGSYIIGTRFWVVG